MDSQSYAVNYTINVVDNGSAAIKQFNEAVKTLPQNGEQFKALNTFLGGLNKQVPTAKTIEKLTGLGAALQGLKGCANVKVGISMNKNAITQLDTSLKRLQEKINGARKSFRINVNVNVESAEKALDRLEARLAKLSKGVVIPVTAQAGAQVTTGRVGRGRSGGGSVPRTARSVPSTMRQALGPMYYNSGTNFAGEMVKGMGMAYGLQAVIGGLTKSLKDAVEYQNVTQTTRNILKSNYTGNRFDSEFGSMESTLRNIGVRTRFTAPEVAAAGKFLAMAGQNINEIKGSMPAIANLALVGDTDLGQTADVTTNIMSGFNIKAQQMDRVADVLVKTFTMSNTTLMELAESFKYVGSISRQAGLKFEDVAAAMGVLGNAGVKGSSAGTALRNIIFNVASPTKKQKEAWDAVGIKTKDENGNVRSMVDLFADLGEYTKNMTGESKIKLFSALFFKRASTSAASLGINAANIDKIFGANRSLSSVGIAGRLAWAKNNMTVEGLWHQTTSAFTEAGMKAFTAIQGPLMTFLKDLTAQFKSPEFAGQIKSGFEMMLDLVKTIMDAISTIGKMWSGSPGWLKSLFKTFVTMQLWMNIVLSPIKAIVSMLGPLTALLARTRAISGLLFGGRAASSAATAVAANAAVSNAAIAAQTAKWSGAPGIGVMNPAYSPFMPISKAKWKGMSGIGVFNARYSGFSWGTINQQRQAVLRGLGAASRQYPYMFNVWGSRGMNLPTALNQSEQNAMFNKLTNRGKNTMFTPKAWESAQRQALQSKQAAYLKSWRKGLGYAPLSPISSSYSPWVPQSLTPLAVRGKASLTPILPPRTIAQTQRFSKALGAIGKVGSLAKNAMSGLLSTLGIAPWMAVAAAVGLLAYGIYDAYKKAQDAAVAFDNMAKSVQDMTASQIDWSDANAVWLNQMATSNALLLTEQQRLNSSRDLWLKYWAAKNNMNSIDPKNAGTPYADQHPEYKKLEDQVSSLLSVITGKEIERRAAAVGIDPKKKGPDWLMKAGSRAEQAIALGQYALGAGGDNQHLQGWLSAGRDLMLATNPIYGSPSTQLHKWYTGGLVRIRGGRNYSVGATEAQVKNSEAYYRGQNDAMAREYHSIADLYNQMVADARIYHKQGRAWDVANQGMTDWITNGIGMMGGIKKGTKWGSDDWVKQMQYQLGHYKVGNNVFAHDAATANANIIEAYNLFRQRWEGVADPTLKKAMEPYLDLKYWQKLAFGGKTLDFGTPDLNDGGGHGTATWSAPDQEKARMKGYGSTPKQIIVNIDNLMKIDKIDATDERKLEAIANLKQELAQALIDVVADVDDEYGRGSSIGS